MKEHRVLIMGDTLLAEGIALMLRTYGKALVTERVSTIEAAAAVLADHPIDVLIIIGMTREIGAWLLSTLARFPGLTVVQSDVSTTKIQVITSRCVEARLDQLLATIAALPGPDSALADEVQAMRN